MQFWKIHTTIHTTQNKVQSNAKTQTGRNTSHRADDSTVTRQVTSPVSSLTRRVSHISGKSLISGWLKWREILALNLLLIWKKRPWYLGQRSHQLISCRTKDCQWLRESIEIILSVCVCVCVCVKRNYLFATLKGVKAVFPHQSDRVTTWVFSAGSHDYLRHTRQPVFIHINFIIQ